MTETPMPARQAEQIGTQTLYAALRALQDAARTTLRHAERSPADVNKSLDALRVATEHAEHLFWPPPPPERPEGEVLYAHAVRAGMTVWVKGSGWVKVETAAPAAGTSLVTWTYLIPGRNGIAVRRQFEADDHVTVRTPVPA